MIELQSQRSYNAKHFLHPTETLKKVGHFHAGHIHYKDGEEFKEINHSLLFDNDRRGWYFTTHSYNPFLPEFSDGWAEFRDRFHDKDQTVKYRAIVKNIVKGELIETDDTNPFFDDNIDNKGVLYKDAFGENRDYLLYNTRSSLIKVATVNNPNEQKEDVVFEWELELPEKEVFRVGKSVDAEEMTAKNTKTNTEDGKLVGYRLRKENAKNFNTAKQTLIGDSKLDGKEWYTYLKTYKAWDSEGNTIDIVARIEFIDGKVILKKTIPVEFLKSAVGRVFTDTTTSYYSGSADGRIYAGSANWSSVRGASTGTVLATSTTDTVPQVTKIGGTYYISKGYFPINTSGLPNDASILSATFYYYSHGGGNVTETTYPANLALVGSGQASPTALVAGDYDGPGATRLCDTDVSVSYFNSNQIYHSFQLNSSGLSAISLDGYTLLAIRGASDLDDTAPSSLSQSNGRFSEYTGSSSDPYLEVTYTEAPASTFIPQIIMS